MKLICAACNFDIPADDINIHLGIAKCRQCASVFNFLDRLDAVSAESARRQRAAVPVPPRYQVESWGKELTIRKRWYKPFLFLMAFFCVVWNGFLVAWYTIALGTGAPWIVKLFPLIHVAVGVGLTYATVCGFVNNTVIRVAGMTLSVRHGPLPWFGNRTLGTSELKQLYCTRTLRRNRRSVSERYALNAVLAQGQKVELLGHDLDEEQALFLEQRIEDHLGIRDERVPGQID